MLPLHTLYVVGIYSGEIGTKSLSTTLRIHKCFERWEKSIQKWCRISRLQTNGGREIRCKDFLLTPICLCYRRCWSNTKVHRHKSTNNNYFYSRTWELLFIWPILTRREVSIRCSNATLHCLELLGHWWSNQQMRIRNTRYSVFRKNFVTKWRTRWLVGILSVTGMLSATFFLQYSFCNRRKTMKGSRIKPHQIPPEDQEEIKVVETLDANSVIP